MSVIETEGLTKRYGALTAVDEVSFTVERGQIFGFLGPNGSGKTTTIGMLLGIITPTSGHIRLLGRQGRAGLHASRQQVGATLETPNFYPYMSGLDNLRLVARVKGVGRRRIDEVLELVGLTGREKDTFTKYSLGMKQRLAIAATMVGDPDLIILDEPANGLDPEGMREIRKIIEELARQEKTIFLSSHLLWEVERTCTHVAILKKGRLLQSGSVTEVAGGHVMAELEAGDPARLEAAVRDYPQAGAVRRDGARILAEIDDDDLAALNRWLADREIHLSHLARRQASLEEAFIALTGERPDDGPSPDAVDDGSPARPPEAP